MILTEEKIARYRQDPSMFEYDSGFHAGSIDAYDSPSPKVFSQNDSLPYRKGYRNGWAYQKAYIKSENQPDMDVSEFEHLVQSELSKVDAWTCRIAKCPDSECNKDEGEWLKVVSSLKLILDKNDTRVVKRIHKDV